ncbi:MAG: outer membrane beta-barrel protein [Gemmatimonadaceae bacterium]|nr:outer membrane beta-barrel protein [Gemmatimonadaceae bacterium]
MRARTSSLALAGALAVLVAAPAPAHAQQARPSLFERLGLDRLHLSAIGIAYGRVAPRNVEATSAYGIQADYGEIARHWHVMFEVGYWGSNFTDETVQRFITQLRQSIRDPAGDDTILVDKVRVSDIALEATVRWIPSSPSVVLRPYLGGGIGAHIVSAESKLIANTFVESALDQIGAGLTGLAGVDVTPTPRVSVGLEARYTLLANVRYGVLRATATYHFSLSSSSRAP